MPSTTIIFEVCLSVQLPTYVLLPKYPTFERASEVSEYSSEYLGLSSAEEGSCSVSLRLKVRGEGRAARQGVALWCCSLFKSCANTLGAERSPGTAINIPI